jgi:rhodanese-related sulfurtransferase
MLSGVEFLTPSQVQSLLARGEAVLIDVREPDEFGFVRIAGAINAPLSSLERSDLDISGHRRVVLMCGSGKRSQLAVERCASWGIRVHGHMAGGINAWREAGLPVLKWPASQPSGS